MHHLLDHVGDATGERLAAMGYCFGGQAVLELARDKAPLAGVVSFHGELDTPLPAGPGDIAGKVLVLTGDDDPVVPFEKIAGFRDEMRAANVDFEVDLYSRAKHSFTGEGSLGPEKTPEAVRSPQAPRGSSPSTASRSSANRSKPGCGFVGASNRPEPRRRSLHRRQSVSRGTKWYP